jgi:hypothetical protein
MSRFLIVRYSIGFMYFWVEDVESNRLSQEYTEFSDALALSNWLHERAAGYPSLKQFEGGANWPVS